MYKNTSQYATSKGGYTLLFAVIVSTLVLSVGLSILTIARKELALTSAAQESEKAIYAADSGIECAYYQDTVARIFPFPDSPTTQPPQIPAFSFTCDQTNVTYVVGAPRGYIDQFDNSIYWSYVYGPFAFSSGSHAQNPQCTEVLVTKRFQWNETVNLHIPVTIIESRGYNVPYNSYANGNCRDYFEYKVERAVRISY